MDFVTLLLHSWLRWVVVAAALVALGRALHGTATRREWAPADTRAGLVFTICLDVQVLVGFVLYLLVNPLAAGMAGTMKDATLRFWAVEHALMMVAALALAHAGMALARRRQGVARFRAAALLWGLAVLSVVAAVPWPLHAVGRPLLRLP